MLWCRVKTRNKDSENMMITGSYDEKIRIWDKRNLSKETKSICVNGGPWRIKQYKVNFIFSQDYLLAACMRGGAYIIENKLDSDELKVACRNEDHGGENLVYGCDW